jgi:plasmid stabilization system protein ParE
VKPVRPNDEAEEEFRHHVRWYEAETAGLGEKLLADIGAAIGLIARHPGIGEPVRGIRPRGTVRRLPLRRFPFLLVYREFHDHLEVVALAHTSRKPRYWRGRLE